MTDNQKIIQNLEPAAVWRYFAQLSDLPRLSGHEHRARDWLIGFAKSQNLEYRQDDYGNLIIYKPAQNSESVKKLCLQAHLDMVPATDPGVAHDFTRDPVQLVAQGDWLQARGTTLGADNGLGVALILAILEDRQSSHPALQALFTVEEETGLGGVNHLDKDLLDPDYVINLDNHNPNDQEIAICVGSAGGRTMEIVWNFALESPKSEVVCYQLDLSDLPGGHSGVDIHKNIPNAIQVLAELLLDYSLESNLQLVSMWGGEADNAIPASAGVRFVAQFAADQQTKLQLLVNEYLDRYRPRFAKMTINITQIDSATQPVVSKEATQRILQFLMTIPSGVIAMSSAVPGLVQTSNNLGVLELGAAGNRGQLKLKLMSRSDNDTELYEVTKRLGHLFCLASGNILADRIDAAAEQKLTFENAEVQLSQKVQGWQANVDNHLVNLYRTVAADQTGKQVTVEAVHAGLECGRLLSYYPQAVAISVGPELHDIHTTRERVRISSVGELQEILRVVLAKL